MRWMRDPTIEPVTPHPDSLPQQHEPSRRPRGPTLLGSGLAVILTVNVALLVALAFGSPENQGPAMADVIARWNAEVDDPDLLLAETANLCSRDGATAADVVKIRAVCTTGVISQVMVEVSRSAGRSQEILNALGAMFENPTEFDTAATGLTFDVTIRRPRLVDPADPPSDDGIPLTSASSDSVYERPGLMYGGTMAMIVVIGAIAFMLRSRHWRLLLACSVAAWSAVLLLDVRFLSSGRALAALVGVTVASAIFNLVVVADQSPPPGPTNLSTIDLRPLPPEIDLTLEPPPLSPRWGSRGEVREDEPPRIL